MNRWNLSARAGPRDTIEGMLQCAPTVIPAFTIATFSTAIPGLLGAGPESAVFFLYTLSVGTLIEYLQKGRMERVRPKTAIPAILTVIALLGLMLLLVLLSVGIYYDKVTSAGGRYLGFFSWVAFAGWIGVTWGVPGRKPPKSPWSRAWLITTSSIGAMIIALPFTLGAMSTGSTSVPVAVRFHLKDSTDTRNFMLKGDFITFILNCDENADMVDVKKLCEAPGDSKPNVNWNAILSQTKTAVEVVSISSGATTDEIAFPAYWTAGGRFCGAPWISGTSDIKFQCHRIGSSWQQIFFHFVTLGAWHFNWGPWNWEIGDD